MVRLASVEFTKLKNVRPGTRLSFADSGAVFLGRNGTGKTTLLEYLAALCRADITPFMSDERFDVSAEFTWNNGTSARLRLTGIGKQQMSLADLEFPDSPGSILIALTIRTSDFVSYHISITDGRVELFREGDDEPLCTPFPSTPSQLLPVAIWKLAAILKKSAGGTPNWLVQIANDFDALHVLRRFDEGLDFFRSLTDDSNHLSFSIATDRDSSSQPAAALSIEGKLPLDLGNAFIVNFDPADRAFFATSDQVTFLKAFLRMSDFTGASVDSAIDTQRSVHQTTIYTAKSLRFMFDAGRDKISHSNLSFGQKRLLSYLYYLHCNFDIGIADELVNGMHHQWIEYCLNDACNGRQMFYTSQNPLLLDFLSFESEAESSERFVTCEWDENEGFVWKNLEPRIGEEFFALYRTGIQHVSEILRTKGWW